MANAVLLALRLEGVLQSWGDHAKWETRDSADFPSKSGVVGLLACAMGLERDNPQITALSDSVQIAVRADRPGTRMLIFTPYKDGPDYTQRQGQEHRISPPSFPNAGTSKTPAFWCSSRRMGLGGNEFVRP